VSSYSPAIGYSDFSDETRRKHGLPIPVSQRSQKFIRTHTETLSVVAMRASNPNRSPFAIQG
jgi:hypothetical protein